MKYLLTILFCFFLAIPTELFIAYMINEEPLFKRFYVWWLTYTVCLFLHFAYGHIEKRVNGK